MLRKLSNVRRRVEHFHSQPNNAPYVARRYSDLGGLIMMWAPA